MREQLLRGIFFIVRRYAWAVLLSAVLLSAGGLYYIRDLQMRSSFLDLLPQDDELLNRFKEKEEIIQKADAVTIVVACRDKDEDGKKIEIPIELCQKNLIEAAEILERQLRANPEIVSVTYKRDPKSAEGGDLLSKSDKVFIDIKRQMENLTNAQSKLGTQNLAQSGNVKLASIYGEFNKILSQFQFLTPAAGKFPNPLDFFKLPSATPLYEGIQKLKEINTRTKAVLQDLPETLETNQKLITDTIETLDQIEATLDRLLKFTQEINFSKDGRAIRIDTRPQFSSQKGLDYNRKIANFIKQTLDSNEISQALTDRSLRAAYTGSYIIATDSNFVINSDMLNTTIISAIGIAIVIVITLRRWLYPLMAMVALFVALIWTFAWAKFSVGGLNLVTSFLPSLILGLGIDYGINFIAYFLDERRRGKKTSPALYNTMLNKGGAILTAALATTLVLFSLMISRSPGLTEMGIIAGMGVLLSLVATLFILPSLMLVTNLMSRRQLRPSAVETESFWYGRLVKRLRWVIIILVIPASVGLGFYLKEKGIGFRFIDDQLAPQNLPSQLVMRNQVRGRFEVGPGAGEYFLFFTRDRAELERVTSEVQKIQASSGEIDAVFSPALFLPPGLANLEDLTKGLDLEKLLAQGQQGLAAIQSNLKDSGELIKELELLISQLNSLAQLASLFGTNETFRNELVQLISQLIDIQCLIDEPSSIPQAATTFENYKVFLFVFLTDLNQKLNQCSFDGIDIEFYDPMINRLKALMDTPGATIEKINNSAEFKEILELRNRIKSSVLNLPQLVGNTNSPGQITEVGQQLALLGEKAERLLKFASQMQELKALINQLPKDLRERFVTANNEYVIYAHVKRKVLDDRNEYQALKTKIDAIEADVLGVPMIAEQLEKSMKTDFLNSTYFAVAIILIIMAIGLRGLFLGPLWGMIPVGLGFLWMLAGMRYLHIDFNFANIVISSILIGNGVDYAVYVLHSYTHTHSIEKTLSETAAPVLGSAVTTMVSFGSLLFANTPGLQVFGTSALLGVGCTTFFTLVFLPALLALRSRD